MKIKASDAINIFRDYTSTVYDFRKINPDIIAISTGYPLKDQLEMSSDMLKALSPVKNGKEISRLGYGWDFDANKLKSAIKDYENTKNKTNYDIDNISLTLGGTHGLNQVVSLIRQKEGNSKFSIVVIAPTFFRLFGEIIDYSDIVSVYGKAKDCFIPSFQSIVSSIKKDTAAIFLCNPSNPVYKFFPADLIEKIIDEVEKRGIYLIIDEVGDAFRYNEAKKYIYPNNINSERVIRVCSASKLFIMAESRLGYVIAKHNIATAISRKVSNNVSHINYGACEAWRLGLELEKKRLLGKNKYSLYTLNYNKNLSILNNCRDIAVDTLRSIKGVQRVIVPDTCFSLVFQIESKKYGTDIDFYKTLLLKAGVSLVPGSGFGIPQDKMWFRLTFAYPKEKLKVAMKRLMIFLNETN